MNIEKVVNFGKDNKYCFLLIHSKYGSWSAEQIKRNLLSDCMYDASKKDTYNTKKTVYCFVTKWNLFLEDEPLKELFKFIENMDHDLFTVFFHTEATLFMSFESVLDKIKKKKQFHAGGIDLLNKQLISSAFSERVQLKLNGRFPWFWIDNVLKKGNRSFFVKGIRENDRKMESDANVNQFTAKYQKYYCLFERSSDHIVKTFKFENVLFANFNERYNTFNTIGEFMKMVVQLQKQYDPWIFNSSLPNPYEYQIDKSGTQRNNNNHNKNNVHQTDNNEHDNDEDQNDLDDEEDFDDGQANSVIFLFPFYFYLMYILLNIIQLKYIELISYKIFFFFLKNKFYVY